MAHLEGYIGAIERRNLPTMACATVSTSQSKQDSLVGEEDFWFDSANDNGQVQCRTIHNQLLCLYECVTFLRSTR